MNKKELVKLVARTITDNTRNIGEKAGLVRAAVLDEVRAIMASDPFAAIGRKRPGTELKGRELKSLAAAFIARSNAERGFAMDALLPDVANTLAAIAAEVFGIEQVSDVSMAVSKNGKPAKVLEPPAQPDDEDLDEEPDEDWPDDDLPSDEADKDDLIGLGKQ